MQPRTKRWVIAPRIPPDADLELHGFPPILRQILYNRGYDSHEAARRFLEARPPAGTNPYNLTGLPESVERIQYAIQHRQKIAIYGDYDADGVTATALLVLALRQLGADVQPYIPNRFDEGYGLNKDALTALHEGGTRLVITVDCGMRSIPEAEHARDLGLDLIITDHHHPAEETPRACGVINPKQAGDSYPDKDLAGVGLAYKLVQALYTQADTHPVETTNFLDLVAIGTVADLAPLVGENRALVRAGLERIHQPVRQGVMALIGASGLQPARISATDIGFALGPRLNAAGRLDSALAAFNLLTTTSVGEAAYLAQELDNQNRERQQITRQIQAQAEQIALADHEDALLLFAAHPDFNPGVVGLAASRLVETYYRPAIVAHQGEEFTRGSCRSISEFHITQALDQCSDLLDHHGGHAAAAGFTVRTEWLPQLVERLQAIASQELTGLDLRPTIYADAEIPLHDLRSELLQYLDWLQPTGYGNPQAVFMSRAARVLRARPVGKDQAHLKLTLTDGKITYDAIAFRQGHWYNQMPGNIDLMYTFELNEFNGNVSLQLNIRDLRRAEG